MRAIERFKEWCRKSNGEERSRESLGIVDSSSELHRDSSASLSGTSAPANSQSLKLQNSSQKQASAANNSFQSKSSSKVCLEEFCALQTWKAFIICTFRLTNEQEHTSMLGADEVD
jgi:hypothetical protein